MLLNDFFHITQRSFELGAMVYGIQLNASHIIYQSHFPGHPITPGVILLQVCKEVFETMLGIPTLLRKVSMVKFLQIVSPDEALDYDVQIVKCIYGDDATARVTMNVVRDSVVYAKMTLVLELQPSGLSLDANFESTHTCVLIPSYNAGLLLADVLADVLPYTHHVIVVNDGSTDHTQALLALYPVRLVDYPTNRGKGYALKLGFHQAQSWGYTHAITMDADTQHRASDLPAFIAQVQQHPEALIVGVRQQLEQHNKPRKNTFANKFSNFWFTVQTAHPLSDTQCGFRAYPLAVVTQLHGITNRYESELAYLVFSCWRGVALRELPVDVYYPPIEQRVSHFRSGKDFTRISVLNTLLCLLALCYGYPRMLLHKLRARFFTIR